MSNGNNQHADLDTHFKDIETMFARAKFQKKSEEIFNSTYEKSNGKKSTIQRSNKKPSDSFLKNAKKKAKNTLTVFGVLLLINGVVHAPQAIKNTTDYVKSAVSTIVQKIDERFEAHDKAVLEYELERDGYHSLEQRTRHRELMMKGMDATEEEQRERDHIESYLRDVMAERAENNSNKKK